MEWELTCMRFSWVFSTLKYHPNYVRLSISELLVNYFGNADDGVDRFMFQWGDKGSPVILRRVTESKTFRRILLKCIYIVHIVDLAAERCENNIMHGYVCMKPRSNNSQTPVTAPLSVHLPKPSRQISQLPIKQCQDGSLVLVFHLCHHEKRQEAMARSSPSATLFACRYGPPVHYTLVCDGHPDCPDGSDETHCGPIRFPPLLDSTFRCGQFQVIPKSQRCDYRNHCFDGSDEDECIECAKGYYISCGASDRDVCYPRRLAKIDGQSICREWHIPRYPYPECHSCSFVVSMDGYGSAFLQPANDSNIEGTVQCRDGDFFIPSFLMNNGELDCKYGEDENIPLTNFTCPGFYRCQDSYSCVHPDHVCDGIHHCPYKDDERYCDLVCPEGCLCEGYVFSCTYVSNFSDILQARSLDLSGSSNISLHGIHVLELLQLLNLSHCGINTATLTDMPNLRILDCSFNDLKNLSSLMIGGFFHLIYLDLTGNIFARVLDNLFGIFIQRSGLSQLRNLILRNTDLHSIQDKTFRQLSNLEVLDLRDNTIYTYDKHVFWGLDSLKKLYTDESKLCCPYFHNSDTLDCVAPLDELSSCSDLLRLNVFRVFLWLITLLAIVGNAAVGLYRLFGVKQRSFSAFRVSVTNLCGADFIMGVYLAMIGIADALFQGQYVAKENAWRRSTVCTVTGFMGLASSEASALTICLITLDRVLVLRFPLKANLHFGVRSSLAACGVVWFVVVAMAAVPLLTGLQFYGVTSICLPLPITRLEFSGQFYSFAVFIAFNFVIFVLIGLGQGIIYHTIVRASKAVGTSRQSQEMTIARRLFLVIVSDFCCWFPIGLMGILVVCGVPISGEVNVWTAIFILPLNSALNPFLYTLNSFLEKQRAEKIKKKVHKILTNAERYLRNMQPGVAEELVRVCIRSQIVNRDRVFQMLKIQDIQ